MSCVLVGYYGFGNLGDDLLLSVSIGQIKALSPDLSIQVLHACPGQAPPWPQIRFLNRSNPFTVAGALLSSRAVIFGGGGIFQDASGSLSFLYYFLILAFAVLLGKKVYLLGQGFGPLRNPVYRSCLSLFLKRTDEVKVRDRGSINFLKNISVEENVRLAADLAFLSEPPTASSNGNDDKPKILLIPRALKNLPPDFWKTLAGSLRGFADRRRAEILILPFQRSTDLKLCERLAGLIKEGKLTDRFSRADLIISMRLHGLILSALGGTPFLGISEEGDPKMKSCCDEFKFLEFDLWTDAAALDGTKFEDKLGTVWNKRGELSKAIHSKIPELKMRAALNFEGLELPRK